MATRRAKAGGEFVGGQFFKGGQFVSKDALAVEAGMTGVAEGIRRVQKAAEKAAFENLGHAARSIRKAAAKSIKQRKDKDKSSPEGDPPFTHGGFLRRALRWDVGKDDAIIGFQHSKIGTVGATHEFGLSEDGRDYPERPTMQPALEEAAPRFAQGWQGAIGE